MSTYGSQPEAQNLQRIADGVAVVGEAVRGVAAETAEFLIEITANAPTAAQALRDNHVKTTQIAQALAALGVQPVDLQTISLNFSSLYSQTMQGLAGGGVIPQIGQGGYGLVAGSGPVQPEVQFGSYYARKIVRVAVRDPGRAGEIVDTAARTGGTIAGPLTFRVSDEAAARRAVLEAAAKDARAKAEILAAASGKQLGDPVMISEDILASNGTYNALRAAVPFAFGAGAPQMTGELEYYARVSARFRLQGNS